MAHVVHVPLIPIPPGATAADRLALFKEWERRHKAANPGFYNSDGSERNMFGWLRYLFGRKQ